MCRRPDFIVPIFAFALALAGCSSGVIDANTISAPRAPAGSVPGHVYLLRGLVGEVFSLGFYDLSARIRERGIDATVHSMYAPGLLAGEIIAGYRRAPAPIVLIGHSSGADAAIDIAESLRRANVPVAVMFGFDPTPLAGRIPANVELFMNLYQKTNLIGGGEASAAPGFAGRIVNVDLRERREIIHITLDKSPVLHKLVADKIVASLRVPAQPPASPPARGQRENARTAPIAYVRPLAMRYVVPPNVPIVLWDSAIRASVGPDETLEAFAARMNAPGWAIVSINNIANPEDLAAGAPLLVPRSMSEGR